MDTLAGLLGRDLRVMAEQLNVTVWARGKLNKGWAGLTVERLLGKPAQGSLPDFGDWELKVVSLVYRSNAWAPKETMAVTTVAGRPPFDESALLRKLERMVIVARSFEGPTERRSLLLRVASFDLAQYGEAVRSDYNAIHDAIDGGRSLVGVGRYIHCRPRGEGLGYYAHKAFVAQMLQLDTK